MTKESIIELVTGMVNELLAEQPECFLVDIRIKPTNNIKVFIDADTGMSIDKCARINRSLYKAIEEAGHFPDGNFSLEVSSPGLDEPLKQRRQYIKNIGRQVEITFNDGATLEGTLQAVNENDILLEEVKGKNKKKEQVLHSLAFDNIKTTKIQIVF